MGEFQRWNTHHSHVVPIKVCGHQLNIAQDPTSDNLGTTIWDASVILVRYMERNPQLYSRRKLEGKRVLELGAGCGLAGMYFALQGAHVTFTDLIEVVPLLQRNVTMNLGGQAVEEAPGNGSGERKKKAATAIARPKAEVLEYCWGEPLDGLKPPYDYVIACDCVYVERLVESLVWSMSEVSGRGTTVLVASEKREEVTYAKFRARLGEDFAVRQAPRRHMDKVYDHENSEVLLCKLRRANNKGKGRGGGRGGLVGEGDGQGVAQGGGEGVVREKEERVVRGEEERLLDGKVSSGRVDQGETVAVEVVEREANGGGVGDSRSVDIAEEQRGRPTLPAAPGGGALEGSATTQSSSRAAAVEQPKTDQEEAVIIGVPGVAPAADTTADELTLARVVLAPLIPEVPSVGFDSR